MNRMAEREERRRIYEQAAKWIDFVDSTEDAEQRDAFFNWVTASPARVQAVLVMEAVRRSLADFRYPKYGFSQTPSHDGTVVDFPVAPAPGAPVSALAARKSHRRFWLAAAAAALLLTVAVGLIFRSSVQPTVAHYRTELGEIKRIALSDGSQLLLDTDSDLTVRLTSQARLMTLSRGRAEFAVAPDRKRPFEVAASSFVVRALGTRFSVRLLTAQSSEVIVSNGRIAIRRFRDDASVVEMSPNDRVIMAGDRVLLWTHLQAHETKQLATWTSGRLQFVNVAIAEAAAEFNRYNRRKLIVTDRDVARTRVSGTFRPTGTQGFVTALAPFGVVPITSTDDVIVLGKPQSNLR